MKNSNIQWCDNTFNPWIGCTKVSPGCAHCYAAELDKKRFSKTLGEATKETPIVHWGKGSPRWHTSANYWKQPLSWNKTLHYADCPKCGWTGPYETVCPTPDCLTFGSEMEVRRQRVFCASLADWLDDEVPIEWLADLLKLIHDTPNLDWLLLTKRTENFEERMFSALNILLKGDEPNSDFSIWLGNWIAANDAPSNVWIGTSVEDQVRADLRIPHLLAIPAKVRFLSCEPLLGPLDLTSHFNNGVSCGDKIGLPSTDRIHWVICGGESGPGARQAELKWYYDLHNQCDLAGVPFFMKQLGSNCMMNMVAAEGESFRHFTGPGKGGDLDQIPVALRVRQFPTL